MAELIGCLASERSPDGVKCRVWAELPAVLYKNLRFELSRVADSKEPEYQVGAQTRP